MDIRIILNPGTVGIPANGQSSKQLKKKTPRRGYVSPIRRYYWFSGANLRCAAACRIPTSEQSSPGSVIHRRSSLRSSSAGVPGHKSYATPITRHSSLRQPPSSPLLRQSRPKKRVAREEEEVPATRTSTTRRRRDSTHSSSAGSSTASAASRTPSHASLLLSRAKQHVALEAVALGRRTRSIMDVVMDLKGAQDGAGQEDGVLMFMAPADRGDQDASYLRLRRDYVLTADEGLEAYWADQAAIWDGAMDAEAGVLLTRFPVSMERSTATWEYP
ncbi:hypothetical protein B0H11DRAFT_1018428 [Mycena galericulata]|nr:hypothetical protein B0H11DRAFT_1018428 [Mycena galericulata]